MSRTCSTFASEIANDVYARCLVLSRDSDEESLELDIVPRSQLSNVSPSASSKTKKTILEVNHDVIFDDLVHQYVRSKSNSAMLTKSSRAESSTSQEAVTPDETCFKKPQRYQSKVSSSANTNKSIKFNCLANLANETHSESKRVSRPYKCTPFPRKFVSALGNELEMSSIQDSNRPSDSMMRPQVYVSALGNVTLPRSIEGMKASTAVPGLQRIDSDDTVPLGTAVDVSFDLSPIASVRASRDSSGKVLPKNSSSASNKFKCTETCKEHRNVRTKLNFGPEDTPGDSSNINVPCGGIGESPGDCKPNGSEGESSPPTQRVSNNSDLNATFYSTKDSSSPDEGVLTKERKPVNSVDENLPVDENSQNASPKSEDQTSANKSHRKYKSGATADKSRIKKQNTASLKRPRKSKAAPSECVQADDRQHLLSSEPFLERSDSLTAEVDSLSVRSSCNSLSVKDVPSCTSLNAINDALEVPRAQTKRPNPSSDESLDENRKKRKLSTLHVNCLKPGLVFEIYSFLNQFSNAGKYGKQSKILKKCLEEAMPCLSLQNRATEDCVRPCNHQACYHEPPRVVSNHGDYVGVDLMLDSPESREPAAHLPPECINAKEDYETRATCSQMHDYVQPQAIAMLPCSSSATEPGTSRDVVAQSLQIEEQAAEDRKAGDDVNNRVQVKRTRKARYTAGKLKKETAVLKKKPKVYLRRLPIKTKSKKKPHERRPRQHKNDPAEELFRSNNHHADSGVASSQENDVATSSQIVHIENAAMQHLNSVTTGTNAPSNQAFDFQRGRAVSKHLSADSSKSKDVFVSPQRGPVAVDTEMRTRKGSGDNDNADGEMALRKSSRFRVPTGYEVKVNEFGEKYTQRKYSNLHEAVILSGKERRHLEKENLIKKLPRKSVNKLQRNANKGAAAFGRHSSSVMQKPSKRHLYNSRDWLDSTDVKNMFVE